ncbi:hypothetical protein AKJ16_DCAP23780, partial [Drosera capensis]
MIVVKGLDKLSLVMEAYTDKNLDEMSSVAETNTDKALDKMGPIWSKLIFREHSAPLVASNFPTSSIKVEKAVHRPCYQAPESPLLWNLLPRTEWRPCSGFRPADNSSPLVIHLLRHHQLLAFHSSLVPIPIRPRPRAFQMHCNSPEPHFGSTVYFSCYIPVPIGSRCRQLGK